MDGNRQITVEMPDVHQQHRKVWMEATGEGHVLHFEALRALPQGGVRCLPRGAQLTRDGRAEVLRTSVPVPEELLSETAHLRHTRSGVAVTMQSRGRSQARGAWQPSKPAARYAPGPTPDGQASKSQVSARSTATLRGVARPARHARYVADGVEVVEEPPRWPEKLEDAVSGWWDNRGDFHEY